MSIFLLPSIDAQHPIWCLSMFLLASIDAKAVNWLLLSHVVACFTPIRPDFGGLTAWKRRVGDWSNDYVCNVRRAFHTEKRNCQLTIEVGKVDVRQSGAPNHETPRDDEGQHNKGKEDGFQSHDSSNCWRVDYWTGPLTSSLTCDFLFLRTVLESMVFLILLWVLPGTEYLLYDGTSFVRSRDWFQQCWHVSCMSHQWNWPIKKWLISDQLAIKWSTPRTCTVCNWLCICTRKCPLLGWKMATHRWGWRARL